MDKPSISSHNHHRNWGECFLDIYVKVKNMRVTQHQLLLSEHPLYLGGEGSAWGKMVKTSAHQVIEPTVFLKFNLTCFCCKSCETVCMFLRNKSWEVYCRFL